MVPLFAIALIALLGLGALVVDLGYWRYEQRMQQAAADSGAIAGANEIPYVVGTGSPLLIAIAQRDVAANGFPVVASGNNATFVTVNNPPASGAYAGNAQAVEVIVTKAQPVFLGGIFGQRSPRVIARSVAARGTTTRNCFYGLDTQQWSYGISINQSTVSMPKCGIISNQNFLANNSTVTATSIGYVNQNINVWGNTYPKASPGPAVPGTDPCSTTPGCAYLQAHPPPAPTQTSPPVQYICPAGCPVSCYMNYTNVTLLPMRYCGNYTFNNVEFLPGAYQFDGNVSFNGGTIKFGAGVYNFQKDVYDNGVSKLIGTDGVTFYINSGTAYFQSQMNLVAPSSGPYAGMLLYQNTADTNNLYFNNGSSGTIDGGMYFPGSTIYFNGGNWLWNNSQVVAKDLVLNSNTNVDIPSASFPGLSTRPTSLVE